MAAAVAAAPEGMEVGGTSLGAVAAVAAPFLAAAMPVTLSAGPPAPSAVETAVIAAAMGIAQNAPAAVAAEGGRRPTSVALAVRAKTEGPAATEKKVPPIGEVPERDW